ncbi:MAG: hypothetical protein HY316_04105 [Acidobacteria bacterium]|nr:hypothetical protein [Acidobacteriota bacterium]
MQSSGVDAAIHELERDVKRVQEVIRILKKIRNDRSPQVAANRRKTRGLSAAGRRRISLAAKKRWATARASKS